MEDLLFGLNDMQRQAVLHDKGPLLLLAGAGSGKTRVLTHRIAYLIAERQVSPYSIIALTFTNKAAGEMKERVEKLVGAGSENIWVSTFHSSCVRILRRWIDTIGYGRDFVIYDTDDQKSVMKEVFKALNIDSKTTKEKTVLGVISHAKDELIGPEQFEREAGPDKHARMYAACYKEYQKRLKANNALDFDDLIFKTIELFDINKEALGYYRRRFRYILVDEYQDTNSAQFMLIHMLGCYTNDEGKTENNICVVGDDDQSIYKFRGANIRNILDFEKAYPHAVTIKLEENYRSTKNILEVANEVIRNNTERKAKRLWTEKEPGEAVELHCYPTDREEAEGVVSEIAAAVREGFYDYSDFAILYRTNAQSRSFEERLVNRNIPYQIIGGQNFYQRKEIKDLLAYLRTIASGTDGMAVKRIINVPKRGIGAATIEKIQAYSEEHECSFYDALRAAPFIPGVERSVGKIDGFVAMIEGLKAKLEGDFMLHDIIDEILEATQYVDYLAEDDEEEKLNERIENINEMITKLADYEDSLEETNEVPSLAGFLDEVTLVADIDNMDEDVAKVLLMTIHSAKGLEFPMVYLVGMEEGIFPGYMSINADNPADEIEEERRLCYVGITRAKEVLKLSYCKQRMMRGDITCNRQSRFLDEIPRHMIKMTGSQLNRRMSDDEGLQRRYGGGSRVGGAFEGEEEWGGSSGGKRYGSSSGRSEWSGSSGSKRYDGSSGRSEWSGSSGSKRYDSASGGNEWAVSSGHNAWDLDDIMPSSNKVNLRENPYKKVTAPAKNIGSSSAEGASSGLGFDVGDQVKHVKFGVGTVLNIVQGGRDYEVTVEFPAGVKKMLASFAKLEKV